MYCSEKNLYYIDLGNTFLLFVCTYLDGIFTEESRVKEKEGS